eukprot:scaffold29127_cov78-Phaeocystis_antarctica.AAC.2
MASAPVNCSSSTTASCCCSSQLIDETVGATERAGGAAGATPRPIGSSNIWARSAGSGGGAEIGAVGAAVGGAARVGCGACVAVFPGSGSESSEEQEGWKEYAEEVALAEEEMALLAFNCPPNRFAKAAAQWTPPAGTVTAAVELLGCDEFKRSGQLLAEAVGATEGARRAAGAAPKPMGSSNVWARSEGSGGGATGGTEGAADGAASVGGGAGVAGSGGWTRPGTAVVVGAGGRHAAEVRAQA